MRVILAVHLALACLCDMPVLLQVVMEFTSSGLGIVESFQTLRLSHHAISVPFLLVGSTRDVNVSFDRSHLNFRTLLIGAWLSTLCVSLCGVNTFVALRLDIH